MLHELFRARGWSGPVVIGGTGGSGTRLVARLLREMGIALGTHVNEAEDAIEFGWLYDVYVNDYLERGTVALERLEADLLRAITRHIDPARHPKWGWKNPRSIYLFPVFERLIPGLTFVHVIRHGLDMATSDNQNQLARHGRAALGRRYDRLPRVVRSALLWKRINQAAAAQGQRMPGRYFLLRYEDVCADPHSSLVPLARALGLAEPAENWHTPIVPAESRWQNLEPRTIAELRKRIGDGLSQFGYAC
jgi:hypothetical protein